MRKLNAYAIGVQGGKKTENRGKAKFKMIMTPQIQ